MNTDLCCVLAPFYRCESCGAVQCKECIDEMDSSFELNHPLDPGSYYMCKVTNTRVIIPRVKQNA